MINIDDKLMVFIRLFGFSETLSGRLLRLTKLFLSTGIMYWTMRAPLQIFFVDVLGMWHVMGNFIAGIILTGFGYLINEFWIWKKKAD